MSLAGIHPYSTWSYGCDAVKNRRRRDDESAEIVNAKRNTGPDPVSFSEVMEKNHAMRNDSNISAQGIGINAMPSRIDNRLFSETGEQLDNSMLQRIDTPMFTEIKERFDNVMIPRIDKRLSSEIEEQLYNTIPSLIDKGLLSETAEQIYNIILSQIDNGVFSEMEERMYNTLLWEVDKERLFSEYAKQLDSAMPTPIDKGLFPDIAAPVANAMSPQIDSTLFPEIAASVDIAGIEKRLTAIAAEDFSAFLKIMNDLRSRDISRVLDALETLGIPRASIDNMDKGDRELLAAVLGKITGRDSKDFLDIFEETANNPFIFSNAGDMMLEPA